MMSGSADEEYRAARAELKRATDDKDAPWASSFTDQGLDLKEIGRGGFGIVSELKSTSGGQDIGGGQGLVVKQILPKKPDQTEASYQEEKEVYSQALEREIEMLVRVKIAAKGTGLQQWVVDIEAAPTIDGFRAIVMKNCGAYNLAKCGLRERSFMQDVLCQVMLALIALSDAGLAHGDVKDTNVMLTPRTKDGGRFTNYLDHELAYFSAVLVDLGAAQRCDKDGGVEEIDAWTDGHYDVQMVARLFNEGNGIAMEKANGFLLDAFAWAGMSTFVHDGVFNKGVHPIAKITTKTRLPEDLKDQFDLMTKMTSYNLSERLSPEQVSQHPLMTKWQENGRSRVAQRSQAVGSTAAAGGGGSSSGGQATSTGGGANGGSLPQQQQTPAQAAPGDAAAAPPSYPSDGQGGGGGNIDGGNQGGDEGNNVDSDGDDSDDSDGADGKDGGGQGAIAGPPADTPAAAGAVAAADNEEEEEEEEEGAQQRRRQQQQQQQRQGRNKNGGSQPAGPPQATSPQVAPRRSRKRVIVDKLGTMEEDDDAGSDDDVSFPQRRHAPAQAAGNNGLSGIIPSVRGTMQQQRRQQQQQRRVQATPPPAACGTSVLAGHRKMGKKNTPVKEEPAERPRPENERRLGGGDQRERGRAGVSGGGSGSAPRRGVPSVPTPPQQQQQQQEHQEALGQTSAKVRVLAARRESRGQGGGCSGDNDSDSYDDGPFDQGVASNVLVPTAPAAAAAPATVAAAEVTVLASVAPAAERASGGGAASANDMLHGGAGSPGGSGSEVAQQQTRTPPPAATAGPDQGEETANGGQRGPAMTASAAHGVAVGQSPSAGGGAADDPGDAAVDSGGGGGGAGSGATCPPSGVQGSPAALGGAGASAASGQAPSRPVADGDGDGEGHRPQGVKRDRSTRDESMSRMFTRSRARKNQARRGTVRGSAGAAGGQGAPARNVPGVQTRAMLCLAREEMLRRAEEVDLATERPGMQTRGRSRLAGERAAGGAAAGGDWGPMTGAKRRTPSTPTLPTRAAKRTCRQAVGARGGVKRKKSGEEAQSAAAKKPRTTRVASGTMQIPVEEEVAAAQAPSSAAEATASGSGAGAAGAGVPEVPADPSVEGGTAAGDPGPAIQEGDPEVGEEETDPTNRPRKGKRPARGQGGGGGGGSAAGGS